MREYRVIVGSSAKRDMLELRRYIANVLHEPGSAERIFASIKGEILSLGYGPMRCPVIRDEPYASLGIRLLAVENYIAFYAVNQRNHEVHVLRVAYNRRDWQNVL